MWGLTCYSISPSRGSLPLIIGAAGLPSSGRGPTCNAQLEPQGGRCSARSHCNMRRCPAGGSQDAKRGAAGVLSAHKPPVHAPCPWTARLSEPLDTLQPGQLPFRASCTLPRSHSRTLGTPNWPPPQCSACRVPSHWYPWQTGTSSPAKSTLLLQAQFGGLVSKLPCAPAAESTQSSANGRCRGWPQADISVHGPLQLSLQHLVDQVCIDSSTAALPNPALGFLSAECLQSVAGGLCRGLPSSLCACGGAAPEAPSSLEPIVHCLHQV